jgi:predicted RNA-binding Zn ribbon-like protein
MDISSSDTLWADLINSDWRDYRGSGAREDRIYNDSWLSHFLGRTGWGGAIPGSANRARLCSLRSLLRRMVEALIEGKQIRSADLKSLNAILARSPVVPTLEQSGSHWRVAQVSARSGFERILAAVAFSFASMLANGDPSRIKICANPDCGWVIYDESRNRTRRWCDVKECGNLIKVRRFRARKIERRRRGSKA